MPAPFLEPAVQAPSLIQNVEQVLPIDQIFPTGALLLGGLSLIGVVLFHGLVMRWVQSHIVRQEPVLRRSPTTLRIDLLMASVILALLGAAVTEVVIWTAVLKYARLLPSWAGAASYAASCYTTLGDASVRPPTGWGMLGPIIAISGLFTFGWSGSVLVNVVGRTSLARDAWHAARTPPVV